MSDNIMIENEIRSRPTHKSIQKRIRAEVTEEIRVTHEERSEQAKEKEVDEKIQKILDVYA